MMFIIMSKEIKLFLGRFLSVYLNSYKGVGVSPVSALPDIALVTWKLRQKSYKVNNFNTM